MQTTTTSNDENTTATATTTTKTASSNELRNQLLQFTCGAMAGISSKAAVAPLERLKTIYQVHTHGRVPSLREGVRLMWYDGGIYGLFRGNLANCIKSAPSASLKLYLFEKTKRLFAPTDDQLNATHLFVSGAIGGCLSHSIVYPLDVIRTRLSATAMGTYNGILDCFFQMYRKEGVCSLYKGLSASLSSTLPSSGISLMVYELVKSVLVSPDEPAGSYNSMIGLSVAGGSGSLVSQCIVYPMKTVKSRMVMGGQISAGGIAIHKYSGLIDVFAVTMRTEGIRGFYKGFLPSLIKTVPSHCIGFTIYDTLRRHFNLERLRDD